MRLIEELKQQFTTEPSYFRQHLIREDIGRLERLIEMARGEPDEPAFVAAGLKVGWTPEDRRTHELKPALEPLLTALHGRARSQSNAADVLDECIARLWQAFEDLRMDRLVGCLARVPRPLDAGG